MSWLDGDMENKQLLAAIRKCATPSRLGKLLGVSHQTVWNWTKRKTVPSKVEKLLTFIEVCDFKELQSAIDNGKKLELTDFGEPEFVLVGYDAKLEEQSARINKGLERLEEFKDNHELWTKQLAWLTTFIQQNDQYLRINNEVIAKTDNLEEKFTKIIELQGAVITQMNIAMRLVLQKIDPTYLAAYELRVNQALGPKTVEIIPGVTVERQMSQEEISTENRMIEAEWQRMPWEKSIENKMVETEADYAIKPIGRLGM